MTGIKLAAEAGICVLFGIFGYLFAQTIAHNFQLQSDLIKCEAAIKQAVGISEDIKNEQKKYGRPRGKSKAGSSSNKILTDAS